MKIPFPLFSCKLIGMWYLLNLRSFDNNNIRSDKVRIMYTMLKLNRIHRVDAANDTFNGSSMADMERKHSLF